MDYNCWQFSHEINRLQYSGLIDDAIKMCHRAIDAFPDNNYFYKVLGDLYFQIDDYEKAANAYLEQLKRLGEKPEHFRAFARFYSLLSEKVNVAFLRQYQQQIEDAIRLGQIEENIHQQLIDSFGEQFIFNYKFEEFLKKSDDDKYYNEIKRVFENEQGSKSLRSCIAYQVINSNEQKNKRIKELLISMAEKRELYQEALRLAGKMLNGQPQPNPTTIRTLLRISRKQTNYSYAESILKLDDALVENSDFNIQYELVYYFNSKNNAALLDKTLKRMRGSASGSLPIARTLYNFYLSFDRLDDAQNLSEHIQKLTAEQNIKKHEAEKSRFHEQSEAQLESEQFVWQRIKDLVSEKEHNRQMLALRELLKGFSHELGQPITNIRYKIQLQQMKIQCGKGTAEETNELLEMILRQTERIGAMLDRFRPIVSSKSVQAGFSINECIKKVFADLSDRLRASEITYSFTELATLYLYGDQIQFSQVFYNLILNSMQAIERGGNINVNLSKSSGFMKIVFTDTGPGIPIENINKIFEPFFSTKDPTSGNGGEGLGLFVVWNILKMYNGTINVNHNHQEGAQFIIKLPVREGNDE